MSTIHSGARLHAQLPELAGGQVIVIDYFASTSACCGVVSGDIVADFGAMPPAESHPRIGELVGVPVFAESRLVPVLEQTVTSIDLSRLPFGRRLTVTLTPAERWLEFLDGPSINRHHRPATPHRA